MSIKCVATKRNLPYAPPPRTVKRTYKVEDAQHKSRRLYAKERAKRRREAVYAMYRKGMPRKVIAQKLGMKVNQVVGIIANGFGCGELTEYVVSDDERQVMELYLAGKPSAEIHEVTGLPTGTVYSVLNRLRREGYLK